MLRSAITILVAIILLGLCLYSIPLHNHSFCFDDVSSIQANDAIRTVEAGKIFNAFNTRFLPGLSFALNYKWCGLNPEGYRLINVLIHGLNAFLVFLLVQAIGGRRQFDPAALFASLLFLCHPIQTEPVNYITQRFVLMGTLFYLAAVYFYVKSASTKGYYLFALFSAVAAMLCKEFTVTLPFMLAVYDLYFVPGRKVMARCKSLLPFVLIALMVPLLLLRTPSGAIGVAHIAQGAGGHHVDITRALGGVSRREYFLTELNVVRTYVRLLVVPVHQNLDYDYPLTKTIDVGTVLSGGFLIGVLAAAGLLFKSYRMASFGTLWFFIALSVESSVIPINHVIAEYRLYLASAGFAFLIASLLYSWRVDQKLLNKIAGMIVIVCVILTIQRNQVWHDDLSLWNATAQESPHKARPYVNRALAWYRLGNLPQALADDTTAIGIDPQYINAYINRGLIYNRQGDLARALADFNKAVSLNPQLAGAYNNRGNTYYYQGNLAAALSDFNKAIQLDGASAESYNDRGNVYLILKKFPQAMDDYHHAIKLRPDYGDPYYNLGFICYRQGHWADAVANFSKALDINPKDITAYNNRAVSYYQLMQYTLAWDDVHRIAALGGQANPQLVAALEQRKTN